MKIRIMVEMIISRLSLNINTKQMMRWHSQLLKPYHPLKAWWWKQCLRWVYTKILTFKNYRFQELKTGIRSIGQIVSMVLMLKILIHLWMIFQRLLVLWIMLVFILFRKKAETKEYLTNRKTNTNNLLLIATMSILILN